MKKLKEIEEGKIEEKKRNRRRRGRRNKNPENMKTGGKDKTATSGGGEATGE